MELESLLTLIDKVSASELGSFTFAEGDVKISMKKKKDKVIVTSAGVPGSENVSSVMLPVAQATGKAETLPEESDNVPDGQQIKAPLVGTFYNAPSPDAGAFVKVGDAVSKGQVLGIIEAMKLMNEIECEYDGIVTAILVENETMVEYGQPLFVIK